MFRPSGTKNLLLLCSKDISSLRDNYVQIVYNKLYFNNKHCIKLFHICPSGTIYV